MPEIKKEANKLKIEISSDETVTKTYIYHRDIHIKKLDNNSKTYFAFGSVPFIYNPTHNCQFSTIGNFMFLLDTLSKEDFINLASEMSKINRLKQMWLVDIPKKYRDKLEKMFTKEYLQLTSPYTSTNGSQMCIYLIKIHNWFHSDNK